jgi:hypothetical protein
MLQRYLAKVAKQQTNIKSYGGKWLDNIFYLTLNRNLAVLILNDVVCYIESKNFIFLPISVLD